MINNDEDNDDGKEGVCPTEYSEGGTLTQHEQFT